MAIPAFTEPMQVIAFTALGITLVLMMYRLVRGPHPLDRVMCVDGIALVVICLMAVWDITIGTRFFFDAILLLAIVGFVSTVAIAKYLEVGDIID